jgi:hypothetical protein
VNPVFLQNLDWLIQPEALRSMAAASRSFLDRGAALPHPPASRSALETLGQLLEKIRKTTYFFPDTK